MTVACIIQARIKSTRLPGKTMLMLPTGNTVIQEVMHRCSQIEGIDRWAVAIPDTPDCLLLHDHILGYSTRSPWHVYAGSENDVLSRYHTAASCLGATHIMRITADCPCLDPKVCSDVLHLHLEGRYGYTSNVHPRSYPAGYDCEVFTREILDWADYNSAGLGREHVTTDMSDKEKWHTGNFAQEIDESHMRLTLDDISDYVMICNHLTRHG